MTKLVLKERGLVDTASLYEVLAALDIDDPNDVYPWAWGQAFRMTNAFIDTLNLNIALSPGARHGKTSGRYAELTNALREERLLGELPIAPTLDAEHALDRVKSVFEDPANVTKLQNVLLDYEKSDDFQSWLFWMAHHGWVEQVGRTGALINHDLLDELAPVLSVFNITRDELTSLAKNSHRREWVEQEVAHMHEGKELRPLARAQVGSALVRAVFQEELSRLQAQAKATDPDFVAERLHLHIHPIRVPVLLDDRGKVEEFSPSTPQDFLSLMILNHARSQKQGARVVTWVRDVKVARSHITELRRHLEGETLEELHDRVDHDEAIRRAERAASALGIGIGNHFEIIIAKFLTLGLIGASVGSGFVLKEWPTAAVGLGTGIAGFAEIEKWIAHQLDTKSPGRRKRLDGLVTAPSGPVFSSRPLEI